jgi:hypothetical protein
MANKILGSEDDPFEIPEFMKKVKDADSKGINSSTVSSSGVVVSDALLEIVEGHQEALGRRRKRKSSKDVKTLKRLGWTASQLNKIDHRQASEYAYTQKAPPKLYERKKDGPDNSP